ncbi:hypothetical protein AB0M28_28205 [Streptomyces sp. NPDC051940]|uniref:hypothetical protein n=1 Tax=Streptomyces sp. NPDC051940 TaxID=3155675 RepID=UPI00342A266B
MSWRGSRAVLAAVVALAAALCGSGESPARGITEAADLGPLPFDRYEYSAELYQRYQEAESLLNRRCMVRRGHDDFPLHPDLASGGRALVAVSTTYGVLDPRAARRWGYGWDPERPLLPGSEGRRLTSAEWQDWAACNAETSKALLRGVDVKADWLYATRRTAAVEKAAARDPRLREAWAGWSRCLADKGFTRYPDPVAAYTDKAWRRGSDGNTRRTPRERATAVADVACKRALGTARVWHDVRAEYQRADIASRPAPYAASLRALRVHAANIDRVLGD